ncbi:MAG: adenylate/guanylate cyclase domain-containing protein [Alphaproteobacteria bacterium]|nr:adenylate/guanylate cyclase domain-containing protein [Alphaproteobacteria bacterium]
MPRFLSLFIRNGILYLLPLAVLAAATAARLAVPAVLDRLSLICFDLYQREAPRQPGDEPIRIVDIDDFSINKVGQWPWPRSKVAELIDKLRDAGAGVIAFDVLFSEPDRTSPRQLLPLLTEAGVGEQQAGGLLATMADPDQKLAEAMAKLPVIAGFALVDKGGNGLITPKPGSGFATAGEDPLRFVQSYAEAVGDLPALQQAAAGNGFINQYLDWDHVVRRVPLVLRFGNTPVPSLAAEALRLGQGGGSYVALGAGANTERSFGENTGLSAVRIGGVIVPTDDGGRVWIHYAPVRRDRFIPAAAILSGDFDPSQIADSIVLIGSSATGLNDLQATPVASDVPGVEIHAQLIEQVLQGTYLSRPDWAMGAETMFAVMFGIVLILALPRIGALPSAGLGAIAVVTATGSSWLAFRDLQLLLDPVYPIIVLSVVYLLASLLGYLRTERRQRAVRNAFSRYMSPHYVAELARHPEKLVLGGETKTMTIMFCDIRGFTTIAEGLDAETLTRYMNRFLSPMTEIIAAHKGTIDKYIGDCIMAFWNAPLDDPDHPKNAVAAAQEMRRRLIELNQQWEEQAQDSGEVFTPLRVGIGINTGTCVVGNFGSQQRFNYSLLGDPVNLAARLESLGKLYGIDLIIGEDTAAGLDEPGLIEVDLVAVKGKMQAVRIYTLPPHQIEAQRYFAQHAELLAAYRRRDWQAALRVLDGDGLAVEPQMRPVYDLYRRRIAHFQAEAPPGDWDGVFTAEEK